MKKSRDVLRQQRMRIGTTAMFAKTLAVGKGFCNHGLCQGGFPLNPRRCTPARSGASLATNRWLDVGAAH